MKLLTPLNLIRNLLPGAFTALWGYFFVLSSCENYIDKKTLIGLPIGVLLAFLFLALKWSPEFDQIVAGYLLSFIFMASLAACTISDIVEMTVPRICSLWLIPFWIIFARLNFLPIDFTSSWQGALIGLVIPWLAATIFKSISGKDGLGMGDIELLSMVGAFLGPAGAITTLNFASISCLIFAAVRYIFTTAPSINVRLPFAPFIALGALFSLFAY